MKIDRGGLEGAAETLDKVTRLQSSTNGKAGIKFLITMENRNQNDRGWKKALKEVFKDIIFETSIRYQAKPITNANLNKNILLEIDKNSSVSNDYNELINEILMINK